MKKKINISVQREGDFEYEVNDGKVTITWYAGKSKEVTIPARIGNLPVTTIGSQAFAKKRLITIGANVVLEARAFYSDIGYPDFGKYYAKVRRQAGTYVFTPGGPGWNRIEHENKAAKRT